MYHFFKYLEISRIIFFKISAIYVKKVSSVTCLTVLMFLVRQPIKIFIKNLLEDRDIPDDQKEKMVSFAVDMNTAYFSGELDPEKDYRSMEEWKLWEQYGKDTFWYSYFNSMLD